MCFEGKTVIVTGAGQGIGAEIALEFGEQKANVVVASLELEECNVVAEKIKKAGGNALPVQCDVSKQESVQSLVKKTLAKFGSIDVLVNNAGIYPYMPFTKMTEKDWDKVIDINLKGVFLCSKEVSDTMIKQKSGRIVNISSIASIRGFQSLTHYCASKGGVNGFTRALSVELAPFQITVNAVLPGPIRTPGVGKLDEKVMQGIVSQVPLGRMGEPSDIANAVLFFASEKTGYITGQTLVVDGGMTSK